MTPLGQQTPGLEALMERYIDGDPNAFDDLYRLAAPRILGQLLRITPNRAVADDVLQITFSKVHRARSSYLRGSAVLPWMMVIAKNALYDERRGLRHKLEVSTGDEVLQAVSAPDDQRDRAVELWTAMDRLPEHYRDAIELTKLAGFSGSEAANLLNTSKAAIKLRVHRGYALLRNILEPTPEAA